MDDGSRRSVVREHRESVSTSARLSSIDGEDGNVSSAIVPPTLDSTDSTATNGSLSIPSNSTAVNGNSLRRPSSIHSRPSSIAKPLDRIPSRPRSDAALPDPDLQQGPDISIQPEAPYEGPSNPSHPYQMYPQRATSISAGSATALGPDGSHLASRAPAHPYGLYPQGTPTADIMQPENIPVGFPGLTDALPQRIRRGGDETSSFVGSVAHSEELPPYTRYPDNSPVAKNTGSFSNPENPSPHEVRPRSISQPDISSDMPAIPGAGGIGLATRDPEFASEPSELGSPRLSARSFTSDGSRDDINTVVPTGGADEKPIRYSWQQQATKRLWGIIPYWAVALMGIVLVLMGVILGAVIGTFLSKRPGTPEGGKPDGPPFGYNSTQEVVLLKSVPVGLPDLETGAWGLLPLVVNQAPSACFEIPDQSQAWSCNAPISLYDVDVQSVNDGPPTSAYRLRFAPSKNSTAFTKYAWGARTPAIPEHQALHLVRDPAEPGLGPAWWTRREYNKTVILPEDRISSVTKKSERERRTYRDGVALESANEEEGQNDELDEVNDKKGKPGQPFPLPGAKEGDRPWICTWPDTVLELFIFPRQNNTFNSNAITASVFGFSTPTKSSTAMATDGISVGETTSDGPTDESEGPETTSPTGGKPDPGWAMPKFPLPPPYPQVVKVSERRVEDLSRSAAYCEQVEIIDGGHSHRPVLDGKGESVRVAIPEQVRHRRRLDNREVWTGVHELFSRDKLTGDCGCVWKVE